MKGRTTIERKKSKTSDLPPPTFASPSENFESSNPTAPPAAGHSFSNLSVVQPQAKLTVSQPGDRYEKEADQVADKVMRMEKPDGDIESTIPQITRKERSDIQPVGDVTPIVQAGLQSSGEPLAAETRAFMEPRFNYDFSEVRVHTDGQAAESARAFHATAFTVGQEVVFGAGEFAPGTSAGSRLLAHELAHVVQQGGMVPGKTVVQRQAATSSSPAEKGGQQSGSQAAPDAVNGSLPPSVKLNLPPVPKGALVRHTGTGVTFTDEPDYVRFQLEEYVNKNGLNSIKRFEAGGELFVLGAQPVSLDPKSNQPPDADGAYLKRVMTTVHEEIVTLRVRLSTFRDDFQRRANDSLGTVLQESKTRIEKELEKYGIRENKTTVLGLTVWTSFSSSDPVGTKKLADDVKGLQSKLGPVVAANTELDQVSKTTTQDDYRYRQAIWEGPHNKYEAALKEYNDLRKNIENAHPMVMAYNLDPLNPATQGHLAKLASDSGSDRAEHVGEELSTRLKNIDKVQKKAGDDRSYVWSLERIVGVTSQLPDIKNHHALKHPGLQSSVIIEKVADIQGAEELIAIGTGIVLFGLGLIADAPTGGLSLAGAAAVSAAGTADAALMIASAYNAFQRYELDSAANATDYDSAKLISNEAPNLFWLALDLVGAFKAVKGGLKSASSLFQQVNRLREEALTAKAMAMNAEARGISGTKQQYDRALAELESSGDQAKPGAGKRLRKEVEQDAPDGRTRGSSAVDPDAEPVTIRNPLPSAANLGAESKGFSRSEAVNEYFRLIQENPDREYAILQHAQIKRFAVVTGTIDNVKIPLSLGDDWGFVRHYHPNLKADQARALEPIPRDSKQGVFGARFPSVFGPGKMPGDVLGTRISSLERGEKQISETLDWFEPETNRMRTSRFGYNPKDIETPYWVEITTRSESTLKGKFATAKDAQIWIWSIDEFRAPTPRGSVPATK